jgi:hypothetical protein
MTITTDLSYLQALDNPEEGEYTRSLLNLIEEQTLDLELAAFLVSHISRGASFITGSGPGGIGKTTTKHALLSFVPADLPFFNALPEQVAAIGENKSCAIADELSGGRPPTYLWGDDLRAFFSLSQFGHILTSTIHADNLEETHSQIVGENDVPFEQFRAINLIVHICLEGGNPPERRIKDTTTRRIINKIYYSDGNTAHHLIYEAEKGLSQNSPRDLAYEKHCRAFLEEMLQDKERSLTAVRQRFLAWNEA